VTLEDGYNEEKKESMVMEDDVLFNEYGYDKAWQFGMHIVDRVFDKNHLLHM
jgi:uncharacterized protein (UPF0303 family)